MFMLPSLKLSLHSSAINGAPVVSVSAIEGGHQGTNIKHFRANEYVF